MATTEPVIVPITPITNKQLTTGELNGDGVFDTLMKSTKAHLDEEFSKGRIKGAEYSQVYLGSMTAVMAQGTQFLLQRDQSTYQALLIQKQMEMIDLQKENLKIEKEKLEFERDRLAVEVDKAKVEKLLTEAQVKKVEQDTLLSKGQTTLVGQQLLTEKTNVEDITTGTIGKSQTKLSTETNNLHKVGSKIDSEKQLVDQNKVNATKEQTVIENQGKLVAQQVVSEEANTKDITTGTIGKTQTKITTENINLGKVGTKLDKDTLLTEGQTSLVAQQLVTEKANTTNITTGTIGKTQKRLDNENSNLTKTGSKIDSEKLLIDQNKANAVKQATVISNQGNKIASEKLLIDQKKTSEEAQTRAGKATDGSVIGSQIALYEAQRLGFKRNQEAKAAKIALDAFAIQVNADDLDPAAIPASLNPLETTNVFENLFTNMSK